MRANTSIVSLVSILLFFSITNLNAQCTDISQLSGGVRFSLNPTIFANGNSFTPTCTGTLRGVTFYFLSQASSADDTPVTVELHQDPFGNNGGPTLVESITQVIPILQEDYSVFFDLTSTVTAGVEYSIRIVRGDHNVIVAHSESNPYPSGRFFKNDFDTQGFGIPIITTFTDDWDLKFEIHYEDDINPVALCQNITRFLDTNNTVTIQASDVDNGSYDTNSSITYALSQSTFNCSDVGENTVILTVEDEAGNTATCQAIVTILDTVAPVLTCPSNMIVYPDAGVPAIVNYDNPVAQEECAIATPDGFTFLGVQNNKSYFLSENIALPSEAFNAAEALGGHLATIVSQEHNDLIRQAADDLGISNNLLIGYNDITTEGTFVWHSGSNSNYTNWGSGSPNNFNNQDYTFIDTNGAWNDIDNNAARYYVIELASPMVEQIGGLASGSEFPDGETTNTFKITDASGNESTCSFTVFVGRNVTPVAVCQNITKQFTNLSEPSELTIAPSELDGGSTANLLLIESDEFIVDVTANDPLDMLTGFGSWNYQEFAFMVPTTGSYTFTLSGDSGSNFVLWDSPILPNSGGFSSRPGFIDSASFYANGNLLNGINTHTLNAGQVYYMSLIGLDPGDLFSGTLQINTTIQGSLSKYISDPCALGGSISETLYAVSYTGEVENCVANITLDDVNNLCNPFITKWQTNTSNETITFPITTNTGTLSIDWGDGTIEDGLSNNPSHSYTNSGTYIVQAFGDINAVHFNGTGSKLNIIDIIQWGTIKWSTMENAFEGCENLDISATDAPNLTQVTNLSHMFYGCESLEGNITFNDWNVSSVANMTSMFSGAELFNQPISNWNVGQVTKMTNMFSGALAFDQPIGNWNVGQVTDMYAMFNTAVSFNQDLNNWNTSNVQIMSLTFYGAIAFNGNISNWNVEQVTEMKSMFTRAENFNQNIGGWNTSNVQEMDYMFLEAINFDQNIGSWNTSQVNNMEGMFQQATSFNQDIGNWNTSMVTDMGWMFKDATLFNQNLGAWDVSAVGSATEMLKGTSLSPTNYDNLLIGWSQLNLQNTVSFGVDATYCFGREGKIIMENTFSWDIDDDDEDCGNVFITKWETSTANETITIPINAATYTYDYIVDWGDGSVGVGVTTAAVHTYVTPGEHTVKIKGLFPNIYFNNSGDRLKLNEIVQWGNNPWASMERAFYGCKNLIIVATDAPDLSNVTNMDTMLRGAGSNIDISLWADISHWDVSAIQDMTSLFRNTFFNQNISTWNVSNVLDMKRMFQEASQFNQDISSWNVSNVENMFAMFYRATNFNQNIAAWDVSNVENMRWMLRDTAFDQNLGSWDISSVTQMGEMLLNNSLSTENYDQTLIGWATDASNVASDGIDDIPTNITLHASSSYCLAEIQRTLLTTPIANDGYDWVINDNDLDPNCNVDNSILSFTLPEQIETADIDENNSTVNIGVLLSTNLTALTPTITISEGATISPNTNTTQDFTNSFVYMVTSENGRERLWTVTVTRMPEITTATTVNVLENQTAVIDVDTTDPEGDTEGNGLTYSLTSTNGGIDNGVFNINPNTGVITFISAPDFENPNDDDTQNDYELQVTVTNSNGLSTAQNITVTIININETSAIDDTTTTDEDNTITINLIANDIDGDGDDLTIQSIDDTGLLGQIIIEADNKNVTYNPNGNFESLGVGQTTTETFTYTVTDGNGEEDTATVTINITGVNDPVQAVDDAATTDEENTITINLIANDIDGDGDDLTIQSIDDAVLLGQITIEADNKTITYDPNGNFEHLGVGQTATDTFTYTVTDSNGEEGTATVTITITGVNDTVQAIDDTTTTDEDNTITINLIANDIDADGDDLTIQSIDDTGLLGQVIIEADNKNVTYNPNGNFEHLGVGQTATETFTYTVTDGNGEEDTATVTITITGVIEPVQAIDDTATTDEENTITINLIANDIDADGDDLTIQSIDDTGLLGQVLIEADNKNVTYNPNGNFEHLGVGQTATETFTYTVTDGNGEEATATVTITITGVNDPVQAVDDNGATTANETITMLLLANDIDIDGDNLIITSADAAGDIGGIVTVSPGGDFVTFDPNGDFDNLLFGESTDVTFSYTVTDGLTTATATATITIVSPESTFTTTWAVEAGESIFIPTDSNYVYDYAVIWGDGTSQAGITGDATHNYTTAGTYTVKILGTFPAIYLGLGGSQGRDNARKILTIEQWGAIEWLSMDSAFEDAENLDITNPDIDTPNLSNVTSMNDMFYDCNSFNGDVTNWDVSNVQDFNEMFGYCYVFNQPIGVWDMSNATSFYFMFYEASMFNQPLDNWDVSNVTNMEGVFSYAIAFDQNLNTWDVSNVTSMDELFEGAEVFNGDISSWDVSNVENMEDMFEDASLFNQNISAWDVSNVENMEDMFYAAEAFNQDISNWDVSNVTNMSDMFRFSIAFDQNLGNWDLSSIVETGSFSSGLKRMFGAGPAGVSLSVSNYDSTLIGWSTDSSGVPNDGIDDIPTGINFGGGRNEYCRSAVERQILIDTYGWSIEDQGQTNACIGKIEAKVYLQGAALNPAIGEENLMRDDLRVAGFIPTRSPYADMLTCEQTIFDVVGDNAIVDWVWVEIHDNFSNTLASAQSALLQRDGDIVSVDGTSPLTFYIEDVDYFIVIKHRNHLGIRSATSITLVDIPAIIDFTDGSTATYGTNAQTSFGMPSGVTAMWTGNVNGDTVIQYSGTTPDTPDILSEVLNDPGNFLNFPTFTISGYNNKDLNMDGTTQYSGDNPDTPIILQNVLAHPGNFLNFSTYLIIEQLPENN